MARGGGLLLAVLQVVELSDSRNWLSSRTLSAVARRRNTVRLWTVRGTKVVKFAVHFCGFKLTGHFATSEKLGNNREWDTSFPGGSLLYSKNASFFSNL